MRTTDRKFYEEKVQKLESELTDARQYLVTLDENTTNVFRRVEIVESKNNINDLVRRIANLHAKLNESDEEAAQKQSLLERQIRDLEYVNSYKYDHDDEF